MLLHMNAINCNYKHVKTIIRHLLARKILSSAVDLLQCKKKL